MSHFFFGGWAHIHILTLRLNVHSKNPVEMGAMQFRVSPKKRCVIRKIFTLYKVILLRMIGKIGFFVANFLGDVRMAAALMRLCAYIIIYTSDKSIGFETTAASSTGGRTLIWNWDAAMVRWSWAHTLHFSLNHFKLLRGCPSSTTTYTKGSRTNPQWWGLQG